MIKKIFRLACYSRWLTMAEQGGRFKVEPVSSPVKDEVIFMVFLYKYQLNVYMSILYKI